MQWSIFLALYLFTVGCSRHEDLYLDRLQDLRQGEYCIEEQTIDDQLVLKHYYYNIHQTCTNERSKELLFEDDIVGCFSWEFRESGIAMVRGTGNSNDSTCALEGGIATLKRVDSQTAEIRYPDGSTSMLKCFPITRNNGGLNATSCPPISRDNVFLADEYLDEKLIAGCYRSETRTCTDYFGTLAPDALSGSCTGISTSCFKVQFDSIETGCPKDTELGFAIEWFYEKTTCIEP